MIVFSIVTTLVILLASMAELKRQLMMFQQNSYRLDRFSHWRKESQDSTSIDKLVGFIVISLSLLRWMPYVVSLSMIVLFGLWNFIRLVTKKYKKPLVFTNRAKRIYGVSIALIIVLEVIILLFPNMHAHYVWSDYVSIILLVCYICAYYIIVVANFLLKPIEKSITKKYYDEAASILQSMPDLMVIGITGSYGKTSTKHYLYRILSEQYDVLMTPGNFNTTLGVVRTVREYMKPYNQIFICEMGAKQINDIKEICDLVHPQIGIVTAVGPMHLESFKTIENVQKTKFEIVDSLPSDGLAVINDDFEFIANRKVENVKCERYSVNPSSPANYHATNIEYTPQGTTFTISDTNGEVITLFTKLVGSCNVSNLMAAVIVALHLGVDKAKIRYAVEKIEQVEHRLNMKRTAGGITIIDDAYNSNPIGSRMALEVLAGMKQGKRIVITPGMIELGDDQYELNKKLGEEIAKSCDIAIVVGEYNRKAICEGIKDGGMPDNKVHKVGTFAEAQQMMISFARPGDTVLYENDLPDTFK